jgi:hypothetical protein
MQATLYPASLCQGRAYRLVDASLIAIGGNASGATTGVRLRATQSASAVTLIDAKVAGLTANTLLRIGTATNGLILAAGASFRSKRCQHGNHADQGRSATLTTATHVDVLLSYTVEA